MTPLPIDNRPPQPVSTGAGLAIAGIWLAAAGLTALLVMVTFVWAPDQVLGDDWLLLILLALPMLAAFTATMRILGRDD
jgi:hypothetical protein